MNIPQTVGEYASLYPDPPAILLGEAKHLDPNFVRIIWNEIWARAMDNDRVGMEAYVAMMLNTHKTRGNAVRDLCAQFTIVCGIDIDIESDEATEAMFNLMENKI
jgi:hypothetical protein